MKTYPLAVLLLFAGGAFAVDAGTGHAVTSIRKEIRCPNPNCHKANPNWAKVCQYCGTKLSKPSGAAPHHHYPSHAAAAPSYNSLVESGNAAVAASNWSIAASAFEQALAKKSNGAAALMGGALSQFELGHKSKALKLATSAWGAGSQGTWTQFVLGMTSPDEGTAIAHLRACSSAVSAPYSGLADAELARRVKPYNAEGVAAVDAKKWPLARREFGFAHQCNPDDAEAISGLALSLYEVSILPNEPALRKQARELAKKLDEPGDNAPWVQFVLMMTSEEGDDQMIALLTYVDANPDGPFTQEARDRLAQYQASSRTTRITIHTNVPAHLVIRDNKGMIVFDLQTDADSHVQTADLSTGTYVLTATSSGYEKVEKTLKVNDSPSRLELTLKHVALPAQQ